MRSVRLAVTIVTMSAGAANAIAQQAVAPGLWEYRMTAMAVSGELQAEAARRQEKRAREQAELAKMSPERRKIMEDTIGRNVLNDRQDTGRPVVARACITPTQAARDKLPQPGGRCKHTSQSRNGNSLKFTFVCDGETQASGEGAFILSGQKEHSGQIKMTMLRDGKPGRIDSELLGRWLAADCGDVKPRDD